MKDRVYTGPPFAAKDHEPARGGPRGPQRHTSVSNAVLRWLDCRPVRTRLALILLTSLLLWGGIILGVGAALRPMS